MDQNRSPYMAVLGVIILLMIKFQRRTPPHKQVTLMRLKQVIHDSLQSLQFTESDFEQTSKKTARVFKDKLYFNRFYIQIQYKNCLTVKKKWLSI